MEKNGMVVDANALLELKMNGIHLLDNVSLYVVPENTGMPHIIVVQVNANAKRKMNGLALNVYSDVTKLLVKHGMQILTHLLVDV